MDANKIICGPAEQVLPTLPTGSVNCSISSPPYWGLRDYGTASWEGGDPECDHQAPDEAGQTNKPTPGQRQHAGRFAGPNCYKCGAKRIDKQLGLEKTFEEYIDKLCTIYDEVKRVLRADGCCFVNLGDTYGGSWGNYGAREGKQRSQNVEKFDRPGVTPQDFRPGSSDPGIPAKSLCLIPQRFAIEMVNRGWILRNTIIWHKPNPMPSSAKDRFTVDYELVFFMVKQKKYFFEPIYEPYLTESNAERPRMGQGNQTKYKQKRAEGMGGAGTSWKGHSGNLKADGTNIGNPALGRNKRTVFKMTKEEWLEWCAEVWELEINSGLWTIPTQAYPDAHFATFPEKLVEPMILAGCPREVCTKCGQGRRKLYEKPEPPDEVYTNTIKPSDGYVNTMDTKKGMRGFDQKLQNWLNEHPPTFKGYSDCGCGEEFRPGIVLDCFAGSCTTGKVAAKFGRNYVMIDLKPGYLEMGQRRVNEGETGISVKEQLQGQGGLFEKSLDKPKTD